MKTQEQLDAMTDARTERGQKMAGDCPDYAYLRAIEKALSPRDRERFRSIYGRECRALAGIRGAADMAVRKLRERAAKAIAGEVVPESWRAK